MDRIRNVGGAKRCEHGFVTCYPCRHYGIVGTGCYYPRCQERKADGEKFCPKHGARGPRDTRGTLENEMHETREEEAE